MHVLVTGGAGFVGSTYVSMLLDSGPVAGPAVTQVTVLDRLTYAASLRNLSLSDPRLEFVHGDICDPSVVDAVMQDASQVVHFAAESHVDRSIAGAGEFVRTNVLGTQVLLESALEHRVSCFVQVSTDEVYGSVGPGEQSLETDALRPTSPYAASKASADLLALSYHLTHGLDVRVTRCSNNYGPRQYPEKVIPLFITRLLAGQSVPLYGDGLNRRDWLHVQDHCRGIDLARTGGRAGEIYNLGGGTELANDQLTAKLLSLCRQGQDKIEYVTDRKGHDRRYSVCDSKARAELGYKPLRSFDWGLAETVEWYASSPGWWPSHDEALAGAP